MKYTVKVIKKVEAEAKLTYVVEAESKFDAQLNYKMDGILTKEECHYDLTLPTFFTMVESITPYKKTDDPMHMVLLKFKRKPPMIVYYNLTGNSALKKAEALKAVLDVERVTDKSKEYEYISIMPIGDEVLLKKDD